MKHRPHHPRHRGYSLIEIVLVTMLFAACAVVANEVFISCVVIQRDAAQAGHELVRAEGVVRMIRTDVWGAESIRTDNPRNVVLQMPDGSEVRWELQITRMEDGDQSHIYRSVTEYGVEIPGDPMFAPADLTFRSEAPHLYLSAGDDSVRLTSFYAILQGDER